MHLHTLNRHLCGAILASFALTSCKSGEERLFKESTVAMGTVVEITVAHTSEEVARGAIRDALGEFQRIDDLMSSYKVDSAISKVNNADASVQVVVREEVFRILQDAVAI